MLRKAIRAQRVRGFRHAFDFMHSAYLASRTWYLHYAAAIYFLRRWPSPVVGEVLDFWWRDPRAGLRLPIRPPRIATSSLSPLSITLSGCPQIAVQDWFHSSCNMTHCGKKTTLQMTSTFLISLRLMPSVMHTQLSTVSVLIAG
jgi:hypothetical protein